MDSNAKIMEFLEMYQSEELIWNPKHPQHKMKHKVNDAWSRISTKMNISVNELKLKKNSLMATFRGHLRKKKCSIKSGMGAEEAYEPIWFAYQFMENFLAPIYECEGTINTENNTLPTINNEEEESVPAASERCDDDVTLEPVITIHENGHPNISMDQTHSDRPVSQRQKRRQVVSEITEAQKQMKSTFTTLNNILTENKNQDCECDLYGRLLAKKLKAYSTIERHQLMHEIDGLLLKKPPQLNVPINPYLSSPAYIPMLPRQSSSFATAMLQTQLPNSAMIPSFSQSPKIIANKCISTPVIINTTQSHATITPKLTHSYVATPKPSQVLIKIPKRSTTNTNPTNN